MSMVEKRAEDEREATRRKDEVISEMELLKGEKQSRLKQKHQHWLMRAREDQNKVAEERHEVTKKVEEQ